MTDSLALKIDGFVADPGSLVIPEMSLSSSRSEMKRLEFELLTRCEAVEVLFSERYEKWALECKQDDAKYGVESDDLLGLADYPPLKLILSEPELLGEFIDLHGRDLLEILLSVGEGRGAQTYWFDKLVGVERMGNFIRFDGVCFQHQR